MTRLVLFALLLAGGCSGDARRPAVLYLSPIAAPEVRAVGQTGGQAATLTQTGGRVYDFSVSPGGEFVLYAAENDLGGSDLWLVEPGGRARQLLDCGADRCFGAAAEPGGERWVYTRRSAGENPGGDPGLPRLWMMERRGGATEPLYRDAGVICELPAWSPDGERVACYDRVGRLLRVYNLEGGLEDMVVEEVLAQAPVWLPDGSGLLTGAAHPGGEGFEAHILRVDLRSREVKELETNLEALEIGGLTIGPDGKRLAFSAAVVGEGGGRDLYLLDLENGTAAERLEDDPRVAVTGCRFGPDGFALACQQITLGQAQAAPMVVLMRLDGSGVVVLAEDAALPSWLP